MPRERAERELCRMVDALRYENSYVTGTWVNEPLGVYVGWVARKDSFSDGMPLRNERGEVTLIFSGEEFPEPGTAQHLKELGHALDAAGPSYLVHLYEEDPSFPLGLNGRFHGLLIDENRRKVMLFNDRWGVHRIYCHQSKDAFYFGAEAKAILAVCPELRNLDPTALGEFIACGCTLEGRTLFKDISQLPGGSKWILSSGNPVKKESYFKPEEWEQQEPLEPERYYSEFREVFSRNLPRYFDGPERIAMSLTGGLDTRMIMAWRKPAPGSLPCYTFGGPLRDCQDVVISRQIAGLYGQSHQVIPADQEFLSRFPYYAERAVYLTDGCLDVSRAPDVHWNARAREIAPVRMTGNYGGELLRGIRTFKPVAPPPGLFAPEFGSSFGQTKEIYSQCLQGNPISFAMFKQAPWNHYGMLALEETQVSLRAPFFDNDLVRTVFRAPKSSLIADPSIRLIGDGDPRLLRIRTDRGLLGERRGLSAKALHSSLEFLFKAEYAYDMGMPQRLARIDHAFRGLHLERLFLGRHKISHFRIWYRDQLSSYVRQILLDSRSLARPYLERKAVEAIVKRHIDGVGNYTNEIHKLLTLELLNRRFIDAPDAAGPRTSTASPVAVGAD